MLTITNLTKKYNENVIFRDLNLSVAAGEVLSIVGPSGIGKTTLLKIMTGLENATAGNLTINGEAINVLDQEPNAQIGVIFQDFNLFPHMTVLENVTLAPIMVNKVSKDAAKQQAQRLLSELGMADKSGLYPYQLSGGQKQRVAIARALALEPKVLAYDEPTSALDGKSTQQVVDIVSKLKATGVTQLVITHDDSFAQQISDRVFDFAKDVLR